MKIHFLSITFFFFTFILFSQNEKNVIDKIAAQIGDNIILISDIQAQALQVEQSGTPIDSIDQCSILEEILFQKLLLHQAKIDSIEIPDAQV